MTLPIPASDVAVAWDHLYLFLFWLSVFFFILVVGGMIYLAVRYRKKPGQKTKFIADHHGLEIFWTIVPTILLMVIFVWGWNVYKTMTHAPSDAMEIRVIGKQWSWSFQYDDGRVLTGEVYVPQGKPVKFVMSSEDVIHSFFVPNMRVKSDVVPGLYTYVWFEAKVPGEHQVYCTEYCGASHSLMLAQLYVLEPEKWEQWRRGKEVEVTGKVAVAKSTPDASAGAKTAAAALSLPEQGKTLTQTKGCIACHSDNGTSKVGPSYKGLYESKRDFVDGTSAVADENYIRQSILTSSAKVLRGFTPTMPSYEGQISEVELNALVAYIKSLK